MDLIVEYIKSLFGNFSYFEIIDAIMDALNVSEETAIISYEFYKLTLE
jgi:hypothetical protein